MELFTVAAATALLSVAAYLLLIPCAVATGLVDCPGVRKTHHGEIPLVGGIGLFVSLLCVGLWVLPFNSVTMSIALSSLLMVKVGMLDDRYDLSVRFRILVQVLAASVLVFGGGIQVESLGDLFGAGEVKLGVFAAPFTILAIMTAMNAYNMIDGIDGLLGSLALVTFIGVAALAVMHAQPATLLIAVMMTAALVVFLLRNLGEQRFGVRKIFMGDSGSMFIGLLTVCMLSLMTSSEQLHSLGQVSQFFVFDSGSVPVRPVAVLWLIAIPLMDMFGIMARRIMKRESPFKPDRDHLHHIFMRAGFSPQETLATITMAASALLLVGLALEVWQVAESLVALLFVAVFAAYVACLRHTWRIVSWVRSLRGLEVVGE